MSLGQNGALACQIEKTINSQHHKKVCVLLAQRLAKELMSITSIRGPVYYQVNHFMHKYFIFTLSSQTALMEK